MIVFFNFFNRFVLLMMSIFFIAGCQGPDLSHFDLEKGKQIYNNTCIACHLVGMPGVAPKVGQKKEWSPRIEQGMEILFQHSIQGLKEMPPKGGDPNLSDEEVKTAVAFMVSKSY